MKLYSDKPPENQGPNRGAQKVQKQGGVEQKDNVTPAKSAGADDRVNISGRSKEVAYIMTSVNQLPEIREAKVQDIKQRVDAGTYIVDPQKVAESILKNI